MELAPGGKGAAILLPLEYEFQSLFLWNSLPERDRNDDGMIEDFGFQSLFLWNSLPELASGYSSIGEVWFQSLFLWNSLPEGRVSGMSTYMFISFNPCFCGTRSRSLPVAIAALVRSGFNPCFCGTRSRRVGYLACQLTCSSVSILVFVELAPGGW